MFEHLFQFFVLTQVHDYTDIVLCWSFVGLGKISHVS